MLHENHTMYLNPLDAKLNTYDVAKIIGNSISGHTKLNAAYDDFSIFEVYKNEIYDSKKVTEEHDFTRSRFRISIEPRDNAEFITEGIFIAIIAHVVVSLRSHKMLAVVVGVLEDVIAQETGWNWTERDQIQPGL